MSITIKDLAKLANVSHTTVSRALNDSPFINEETKKKILDLAKEFNYVPNFNAKSLVLQKSYNIGLFFSTITQGTSPSFFHKTIVGVNSVIKGKYNILVRGIDDLSDFLMVNNKTFDGIIVMSQSENDNPFIYDVLQKQIPMVVLNREIMESSVVNILSADKKGSYTAVTYLIDNGHRDIAIIEGKKGFKSSVDRKDGYLQALIERKVTIKEEYMISGNYDTESGYSGMKKLLELPKVPTAVFCSNDDMAVGAMKAVLESGLRIPEDISFVGFDNSEFCKYVNPALTTVKKPIREVSITGSEKLLKILDKEETKGEKIYIPTELIIRESVAKLNTSE